MTNTDVTRERKLRMTRLAMWILFGGLIACLLTAAIAKESVGMLVALYTPFGMGIGAALGLFINGNVKVHQANASGSDDAPAPEGKS